MVAWRCQLYFPGGGAREAWALHFWATWSIPLICFTNVPIPEDEMCTKHDILEISNAIPAIWGTHVLQIFRGRMPPDLPGLQLLTQLHSAPPV